MTQVLGLGFYLITAVIGFTTEAPLLSFHLITALISFVIQANWMAFLLNYSCNKFYDSSQCAGFYYLFTAVISFMKEALC